jgi:hypothetical protein
LLIAVSLQFNVVSKLFLLDIKLEDFCISKPFSFARIYKLSSEILYCNTADYFIASMASLSCQPLALVN